MAYEIFEQIGVPDWIAVPIGAGPLLVGIREGFEDLRALGVVEQVPRLLALQPSGLRADRPGVRGGARRPGPGARPTRWRAAWPTRSPATPTRAT